MSRTTVSAYRDREAERRRAEARELSRLERALQHLSELKRQLAELEPIDDPVAFRQAPVGAAIAALSASGRREWLDRIPGEVDRIEQAIRVAKERRLRLALTARSLIQTGAEGSRKALERIAINAKLADRDTFIGMQRDIAALVTARIFQAQQLTTPPTDDAARRLARQLLGPELSPVPTENLIPIPDDRLTALVRTMAHLGSAAEPLLKRAEAIFEFASSPDFQLKLDSLCLDASGLRNAEDQRRKAFAKAEETIDSLAPFDGPSAASLRMRLATVDGMSTADFDALLKEAKAQVEVMARTQDAERARKAIVLGLEAMGYAVQLQDGAWNPGERISIQRPDEPNYDIQLAAAPDGRIQTKVRAFLHPGRSSGPSERDQEVEKSWCDDFRSLHERLELEGVVARLEHEDAPGSAAVLPIERVQDRSGRPPEDGAGLTKRRQ